jgi:hypothetical protein
VRSINRVLVVVFGVALVTAGILSAVALGLFVLGWFIPGAPWSISAIAWIFADGDSFELLVGLPVVSYSACKLGVSVLAALKPARYQLSGGLTRVGADKRGQLR